MMLGPDASLFQERVQDAVISGNIDNPEGGFDGLVQVRLGESRRSFSVRDKIKYLDLGRNTDLSGHGVRRPHRVAEGRAAGRDIHDGPEFPHGAGRQAGRHREAERREVPPGRQGPLHQV